MNQTPWMTVEEAAQYLRCGQRYLREALANKSVPHVMFAGKALFHPERLDEWLLRDELTPNEVAGQHGDSSAPSDSECREAEGPDEPVGERVGVGPDCSKVQVAALIQELIDYGERFVSGLGRNLKTDLDDSDYQWLSRKVYAQLSRWCHPNRDSRREQWVRPRAHEISKRLFGKVISRSQHPSYAR